MTKKIAHIIIGLNVGGAELMLHRLVLNSSRKGMFEHHVISLTDLGVIGSRLQEEGIPVYSLGMKSVTSVLLVLIKLQRLLRKIQPDIVQTWMYHADFLGGLAAKSIGVRNIIWGIRTTDPSQSASKQTVALSKLCAKLSYFIPNTIICVAHTALTHHESIGYKSNNMIVIPNGFDLTKFYPDKNKRVTLRRHLGISEDELVIGNIGRFNPVKNQLNFIQACLILLNKGYRFKVLLAGRNLNLDNMQINTLLDRSTHREHFIFLGEYEDTPSFYNAIDALCLCSVSEGFPNVLGEAMATAKVCYSTDAGDAYIILGSSGFKIDSTSAHDISLSLESNWLKKTRDELSSVEVDAYSRIKDNFSIAKVVTEFEQLYTEQ